MKVLTEQTGGPTGIGSDRAAVPNFKKRASHCWTHTKPQPHDHAFWQVRFQLPVKPIP